MNIKLKYIDDVLEILNNNNIDRIICEPITSKPSDNFDAYVESLIIKADELLVEYMNKVHLGAVSPDNALKDVVAILEKCCMIATHFCNDDETINVHCQKYHEEHSDDAENANADLGSFFMLHMMMQKSEDEVHPLVQEFKNKINYDDKLYNVTSHRLNEIMLN